jgi:hypothetical protein
MGEYEREYGRVSERAQEAVRGRICGCQRDDERL